MFCCAFKMCVCSPSRCCWAMRLRSHTHSSLRASYYRFQLAFRAYANAQTAKYICDAQKTNKQTRASTKQNFYLHNNFCTLFLIYKTRCWFAFSSIDQFIIHTTTEFQPELNERSEQKMGLHSPMQAAFFLNIINASCSCQ